MSEYAEVEKRKSDPKKFDKLAQGFVEHLLGEGEYPLSHAGRFYVYQGNCYAPETELAKRVRKWMERNGKGQSNNVVGNVVPIVETMCWKPLTDHPALPFYVGKEAFPKPKNIIAYKNGLLDLDAYLAGGAELIAHTPKWISTVCLPHDFDPQATCPRWRRFLDEVYEDDAGRIALLQEWFGYCLTPDTAFQKMLMMIGKKRSGKGTIHHVLQRLLGDANWCAYSLTQLATEFGLSPLLNKTAAFVGEVELSGHPQRTAILERLKSITGEDAQVVNEKHKELTTAKLGVRFVVSCNDMPTFFDASGALASRLLFLPHRRSFAGREDTTLREKLVEEATGINLWALQGLARLRAGGGKFTTPPTSSDLLDDFSRMSSPVEAFVQDCLLVEKWLDPGDLPRAVFVDGKQSITRKRCYELYEAWCRDHDMQPRQENYFGADLFKTLPRLPKRARHCIGGKQEYVYPGIGERPDAPKPQPTDAEMVDAIVGQDAPGAAPAG
jgi:putative DNA primase/helicase